MMRTGAASNAGNSRSALGAPAEAQHPTHAAGGPAKPRRASAEPGVHLAHSLLEAVARGLVPRLDLISVDADPGCPDRLVAFLKR